MMSFNRPLAIGARAVLGGLLYFFVGGGGAEGIPDGIAYGNGFDASGRCPA